MKIKNILSASHLIVQLVLALLIAALLYWGACELRYRLDLSAEHVYSLSPQTLKILEQFHHEPIDVYAFYREDQLAGRDLETLLKQYQARYPELHYTFSDPY